MPSASAWPLTQVTADRGADACVIRIRRRPHARTPKLGTKLVVIQAFALAVALASIGAKLVRYVASMTTKVDRATTSQEKKSASPSRSNAATRSRWSGQAPSRLRNSDFQQVRTRRRWFSHEPVQRRVIAAALSSEIETMPPRYLGVIRGIPVNAERLKAKVQQRAVWQYVSFLAGQAEVRC